MIKFIPGVHPTCEQQRQKIIDAYMKGEIQPCHPDFCFCGTLCNNTMDWFGSSLRHHNDSHGYSGVDFLRMETALFSCLPEGFDLDEDDPKPPNYEQMLFEGMCAALDVLKQIHIEHGEIIDEVPAFTKRALPV